MKLRSYPLVVFASLVTTAGLGLGLFFYGRTLPVYSDIDRARELKGPDACDANGPVEGWYEQLEALETLRHPLMQGGLSLVLTTFAVGALYLIFADRDCLRLRTPRSRLPFFALGIGVILLSWFAQMVSFYVDLDRGSFPWCADSIIIGMFQLSIAYLIVLLAALVVGGILSIGFKNLPTRIFAWRSDEKAKSILVSAPFVLISACLIFLGIDGATHSSFLATPAAIFALYLTEATRSALLARDGDVIDT